MLTHEWPDTPYMMKALSAALIKKRLSPSRGSNKINPSGRVDKKGKCAEEGMVKGSHKKRKHENRQIFLGFHGH